MREPFLVKGIPSVLWWQVNNPGCRQLEWVGEAHLSPVGATRLRLLLLGRQTENTRDSVTRQWTNVLLHRHEHRNLSMAQTRRRITKVFMCACEGLMTGRSISPLRQRQPLCPLRFPRPARHRSIPIRRPPFYAADRWNQALDVPGSTQ